ncbi:MAG: DNA polymerase IV [Polyangiaceae bacterium]
MSQRWVLHADMDAFYASIEQRDHPELRGRPVIVGASSPRGVVSAASYEARRFGVRSAMPGFRARELCPQGVFVGGDMQKYSFVSRQVRQVFEEFTPEVQPLALDEAFLDVTGSLGLFGSPRELARALKRRVREETNLVVSVGLGPNKLVAKIACTQSKPDGLLVVEPSEVEAFLRPLPVRRLWGVGPVLGETLARYGIQTIGDLSDYDSSWLEQLLGCRAHELQAMARGEDTRPVESQRAPKSYGEENTFERDVTERERVSAALTAHAESVAARMRKDHFAGRTVTLRAKLGRRRGVRAGRTSADAEPVYPLISRSRTLPQATADGALIRRTALELWDELGLQEPVRLLGVSVSKLERQAAEQLDLFAPRPELGRPGLGQPTLAEPGLDVVRGKRLGGALDAIRERFGDGAIRRAVEAPHKITHSSQIKAGQEAPIVREERRTRVVELEDEDAGADEG